jgi:hypothetical protein
MASSIRGMSDRESPLELAFLRLKLILGFISGSLNLILSVKMIDKGNRLVDKIFLQVRCLKNVFHFSA